MPAPERVPILTYHSLDEGRSPISLSPSAFRTHMRRLADTGHVGVTVGEILDAWSGGLLLPERPVGITFDDGFASVADHAAPLLAELRFRATLFVVSGHAGKRNDWPTQPAAVPRMPLLSWGGIADLAAAGWEIGAHGETHAPLTALSDADAEREMAASARAIEEAIGRPVTTFAYPYGSASPRDRAMAKARFRGACGVRLDVARRSDDPFDLPRIEMHYFRGLLTSRLLRTAAEGGYLAARRLGREAGRRLRSGRTAMSH